MAIDQAVGESAVHILALEDPWPALAVLGTAAVVGNWHFADNKFAKIYQIERNFKHILDNWDLRNYLRRTVLNRIQVQVQDEETIFEKQDQHMVWERAISPQEECDSHQATADIARLAAGSELEGSAYQADTYCLALDIAGPSLKEYKAFPWEENDRR